MFDGFWMEHRLGRRHFRCRFDDGRKTPLCPAVQIGQRIHRPPAVLLKRWAFASDSPLRQCRYGDADTVLAVEIMWDLGAPQPRRQIGKIEHDPSLSSHRAGLREYGGR